MEELNYLDFFNNNKAKVAFATKQNAKILIAEDDDITAKLIEKVLSGTYPNIERVSNGLDVIKKLNDVKYDLILLDIQIPIINGYEVCSKLKSSNKTSDIPIIFITGKNDIADIQKAFEAGGNDYLTKPVRALELLERIKLQLKVKGYIDIIKNQNIELIEKERKYRLINENIVDVIWVTDLNLKHIYISPSIKKFQGYDVDEFLNIDIKESLTPESLEIASKTIKEYLAKHKQGETDRNILTCTLELQYYRKDGTIVWGELTASPFYDLNHNIIGIQGVTRNIDDRKNVQLILKENEAKFKAIFEYNLDCLFILDKNLKIIRANQVSKKIFNCESVDMFIGLSMYDISTEYQNDGVATVIKMEK